MANIDLLLTENIQMIFMQTKSLLASEFHGMILYTTLNVDPEPPSKLTKSLCADFLPQHQTRVQLIKLELNC